MRSIFISYRRDDAEGEAGRLYDVFAEHFGEDAVFMDVTGIAPGRDFRKVIDESVATCGVLLAVIGQNWAEAKDQAGSRRLDDPDDFVRYEIAAALNRDVPLIPVLVHGARMPRPEHLTDDIKNLAYRNAFELAHARWASDVQRLRRALHELVPDLRANHTQTPVRARMSDLSPGPAGVAELPSVRSRLGQKWLYAAPLVVLLCVAGYGAYSTLLADRIDTGGAGQVALRATDATSTKSGSGDDLTYGTWTLTKAIDDEGTNWGNSTLTFTSQKKLNDGFRVVGFFEWRANNVLIGREEVEGQYQPSQARIILESKRVIPLREEGRLLGPGSFSAKLSADGRGLVDGTWGTVAGVTDPNVRKMGSDSVGRL